MCSCKVKTAAKGHVTKKNLQGGKRTFAQYSGGQAAYLIMGGVKSEVNWLSGGLEVTWTTIRTG